MGDYSVLWKYIEGTDNPHLEVGEGEMDQTMFLVKVPHSRRISTNCLGMCKNERFERSNNYKV